MTSTRIRYGTIAATPNVATPHCGDGSLLHHLNCRDGSPFALPSQPLRVDTAAIRNEARRPSRCSLFVLVGQLRFSWDGSPVRMIGCWFDDNIDNFRQFPQ